MAVRGLGLGLGAAPVGFKGGGAVLWPYSLYARARGTSGGACEGIGRQWLRPVDAAQRGRDRVADACARPRLLGLSAYARTR